MSGRQPAVVAALVIVSLALAVYAPTLAKPFMFDDLPFILYETGHRDLSNIPSFFTEDQHLLYRPLRSVAYTLMYAAFGYDAIAYRAVAVLLHALFSILMAGIALRCGLSAAASFLTGLLFLLHPVHADRAAFTTAAFDLVGPIFGYAALYVFMRSDQRDRPTDRYLGLFLLALGLAGGEESVLVPVLFYVWRWTVGRRADPVARPRVPLAPLAMAGAYILVRTAVIGQVERVIGTPAPFTERLLNSFPVTAHALLKVVFPFALRPAYGEGMLSPADPLVWISAAFLSLCAAVAWRARRRYPLATFAAIWFAATWSPYANLLPNSTLLAERYLYLPAGAFCLLGGRFFDDADLAAPARSAARSQATALVFAVLLLFGALSFHRGWVWADETRLWTDAYRKDSRSGLVVVNFANTLRRAGEVDPCPYYARAMALSPDRYEARVGWGSCLVEQGRVDEALLEFETANRAAPEAPGPLEGICQIFAMRDRYEDARECSRQLLERNPESIVGLYVLGYSAFRLQDFDEARRALGAAADDSPRASASARAAADLLKRMPRGAEP